MARFTRTRLVAEYNGRRGQGTQRAVSTAALRLPVELSQPDGRVPGHVGATLSTPQRPRVRRLHTLHRRGLPGSRESEFSIRRRSPRSKRRWSVQRLAFDFQYCRLLEKMDLEECLLITDTTLIHLGMGCPRLEKLVRLVGPDDFTFKLILRWLQK